MKTDGFPPSAPGTPPRPDSLATIVLHAVFAVSGVAALIYQLIWQRSLLMIYGSNSESVTMVVTAFMLGLGLGSVGGGALSQIPGVSAIALFCGLEAGIGLYGLGSLRLFQLVGTYTLRVNTLETGVLAFALVFVPTALMGATLPLLVSHRVRAIRNVGRSVSWLYFANTLGASVGAFTAAFFVLHRFGLSGAVRCAAILNLISVLAVAGLLRRKEDRP